MSGGALLDEADLAWPNGELVDIASIDQWSEHARVTVTPQVDDGVIRGPEWVLRELDAVSHLAAQMVVVVKNAGALKRARAGALRRARAGARLRHVGKRGTEQTALVEIDVEELQAAFDEAAIAEEYAREVGDLVKDRRITVQSMGRQIEILYRDASGRGA